MVFIQAFSNIADSLITMYALMLGGTDLKIFCAEAPLSNVTSVLMMVYIIFVAIILYQMLIALIIESHSQASALHLMSLRRSMLGSCPNPILSVQMLLYCKLRMM